MDTYVDDEGTRARLFENLQHEDADHVQRGNYFLVAETLLVVAYTSFDSTPRMMLVSVALFGSLISIAWLYVQHHQLKYIRYLQARCREALPEYRRTSEERPRARVPVLAVFAYVFPSGAVVLWLALGLQGLLS